MLPATAPGKARAPSSIKYSWKEVTSDEGRRPFRLDIKKYPAWKAPAKTIIDDSEMKSRCARLGDALMNISFTPRNPKQIKKEQISPPATPMVARRRPICFIAPKLAGS